MPDALTASGFALVAEPIAGNESRFFSANLSYPSEFKVGQGLKPHIRIEMSFRAPALAPIPRPIGSLIAAAQRHAPEVSAFACVDPVETAADKLSAHRLLRFNKEIAALQGPQGN